MALPKRQNPGDEDCIKVYYEDLSVCTSYACLHQLRLFASLAMLQTLSRTNLAFGFMWTNPTFATNY